MNSQSTGHKEQPQMLISDILKLRLSDVARNGNCFRLEVAE